ncbi:MAG: hypothetical protein ACTHMO_12510 [Rhodanobacteraceae bacterium]
MNALAGWGFTDAAALDRHVRGQSVPITSKSNAQARWVTPEKIAAYAATLSELPTPQAVMQQFRCCYATAIKHRRKVADLIGKRGKS